MKKSHLSLVLFFSMAVASAQQNNVVSAIKYLDEFKQTRDVSVLKKAQARIDTASNHPDTRDKAKTWHTKGDVYYDIFSNNFETFRKQSTETDEKKKNADAFAKVDMKELEISLAAYQRCIELDTKDLYKTEDKKNLNRGVLFYYEKAVNLYNRKEFSGASVNFENASLMSLKYLGKLDTNAFENAEVASGYAKEYDRAISLSNKLIDMKVKTEMYYEKNLDYYKLKKDKPGMADWVKKGRVTYPNNVKFIIEELNQYITEGKSVEALGILDLAIEKDSKNADLYRVKGQTYSNLAFPADDKKPVKFDEYIKQAETSLLKANDLKPNDSGILYSIGAFYNNWGAFVFNQAQNEKDMSKLAAGEKVAEGIFLKAIPYLEKEIELDPTDKDACRALKQLYLKTGQGESDKYKKVDALLKN